jgi:PAS domain S-box-containing protein
MESELEKLLQDRLRALEAANQMLSRNQQAVTAKLYVAELLQDVILELTSSRNIDELYEQILDTLMAILHSDFASLQMLHPERGPGGELRLLGHRGFSAEAARHWEWVRPATGTTCGEALRIGKRVAVADVRRCDFISGSDELQVYLGCGIIAVQTTPLVSRTGALVGALSTHWREPHEMSAVELHALDILGRLAADLIERTRTEEALRRAVNFQSSVTSNMEEGLYTLDTQGCVTSINPAAERLFGWTFEELRGRTMHDVTHYKHRDGSAFPIEQCAGFRVLHEGHTLAGREDVFIRKDGTFFDVIYSSSPLRGSDGAIEGVVVVFRDVTEKKAAEQALRESEEQFRKYFELGLVGMAITSPSKGILEVNDEACKILGYQRA